MAWLAVDKDGDLFMWSEKPTRDFDRDEWDCECDSFQRIKTIGFDLKLTWDDEPIEI